MPDTDTISKILDTAIRNMQASGHMGNPPRNFDDQARARIIKRAEGAGSKLSAMEAQMISAIKYEIQSFEGENATPQ